MYKSRKIRLLKEQRERTLNVRLPCIIRDATVVEDLFFGDFCVKLPRQSSRSCRVVFTSVEEKIKNRKFAKDKTINGKRVIIKSLSTLEKKKIRKVKRKKVFMPEIKPDIKVTQTMFIGNIALGTNSQEIRDALPGCISVTLLKPYNNDFRSAIVKMENIQIAMEYLKKERNWPVLRGRKVCMKSDTRAKYNKRRISKDTEKISNGDVTERCKYSKRCKNRVGNYVENKNERD